MDKKNITLCDECKRELRDSPLGQGVCIAICKDCSLKEAYDYLEKLRNTNSELHWILAKFLHDSLDFLADDPRAKGMKRMDWINEWISREMPIVSQWMPKSYIIKNID